MAPRIFTLLRSPVTGTSGGQPTRLQVACRVESCRKLASSVKISAQCRAWAFFKVRIDVPAPAVLRRDIGAGQNAAWTLHRKPPGMEQQSSGGGEGRSFVTEPNWPPQSTSRCFPGGPYATESVNRPFGLLLG